MLSNEKSELGLALEFGAPSSTDNTIETIRAHLDLVLDLKVQGVDPCDCPQAAIQI